MLLWVIFVSLDKVHILVISGMHSVIVLLDVSTDGLFVFLLSHCLHAHVHSSLTVVTIMSITLMSLIDDGDGDDDDWYNTWYV